MKEFASIFTGNGGTIKVIAVVLGILGIGNLITENKYQMEGRDKNGNVFSVKPTTADENIKQTDVDVEEQLPKPADPAH